MLNLVGRLTPWDFCGMIQWLTDNADSRNVQDVYRQFNQIQRQWRAGWTVYHALCQESIFLRIGGKTQMRDDLKYAIFLGGDGNMRLRRNNKGGGEASDPSLFGDGAFYAENDKYKDFYDTYLSKAKDITCRGFRAGDAARSGAFFKGGTVDLPKGERFVNFDFALVQVLLWIMQMGLHRIIISYDIACKYHINFMERIAERSWPLMTPTEQSLFSALIVVWLVPKFHLAAHIEGCADKFSFNWTKNVGRTCGELVESNWAALGMMATSIREMGFGHRRDTINDAMCDWNWRKATGESIRVLKAFRIGQAMCARKCETLEALEEAMGIDLVEKLTKESVESNGSQYRPRVIESPSRMAILKKLQEEEAVEGQSSIRNSAHLQIPHSVRLSRSVGINMGIDIEMRQQMLHIRKMHMVTDGQKAELLESRRKMSRSLDMWFQSLNDFMPSDAIQELRCTEGDPENAFLGLPSDFPCESQRRLGLEALAIVEQQLRIGQAHDALKKLRTALGLKNSGRATSQVQKWKEVYQRSYKALEHLRGNTQIPETNSTWSQLKELSDSDCIMLSEWMDDHRTWGKRGEMAEAKAASGGKGKRELAWFWKLEVTFNDESSPNEIRGAVDRWTTEVIRIEWLHAKASHARWDEEVRLLGAEGERIGKTFRYLENIWKGRQGLEEWNNNVTRGAAAFAHRQMLLFRNLAEIAEGHYEELRKESYPDNSF
ncbi:hypothetical protein BU17DRAFT_100086 [Hysterangium stoloniferum]|nr:hypothetical protein BU17DRAFT_100086 [Hysterangium stoloniferum]